MCGPDTTVPVLDAASQEVQNDWTLREWAAYFAGKTAKDHKVLNVLSLEATGTRLGDAISAPKFVRDLDWIPRHPRRDRPKVQKQPGGVEISRRASRGSRTPRVSTRVEVRPR